MLKFPNYSFDVEINITSYPNIKIEFIPDTKQFTKDEYFDFTYSIAEIYMIWEFISFHGGFKNSISKMHGQPYTQYGRRKYEYALYLEEHQLSALNDLFYLIENGYNKDINNEENIKISKIKVSSISCEFYDYVDIKRGYK